MDFGGWDKTSTYLLCIIDLPDLQEDDGEDFLCLVLFCGNGILPGEYALCELASEGIVALDDEVLRFREQRGDRGR